MLILKLHGDGLRHVKGEAWFVGKAKDHAEGVTLRIPNRDYQALGMPQAIEIRVTETTGA